MHAILHRLCQFLLATPLLLGAWLVWSASLRRDWPHPGEIALLVVLLTVSATILGIREWTASRRMQAPTSRTRFPAMDHSAA